MNSAEFVVPASIRPLPNDARFAARQGRMIRAGRMVVNLADDRSLPRDVYSRPALSSP
jgi:hypothetical protein